MKYINKAANVRVLIKENIKDGVYFAMLFTLRESLRTSDSVLLRIRSKGLRLHPQAP